MAKELCPLLMLRDSDSRSDMTCYGKDCAWYYSGRCALKHIAIQLDYLEMLEKL